MESLLKYKNKTGDRLLVKALNMVAASLVEAKIVEWSAGGLVKLEILNSEDKPFYKWLDERDISEYVVVEELKKVKKTKQVIKE